MPPHSRALETHPWQRKGGDDKRQRTRIKAIRKSLQEQGWKSFGRQLEGV